MRYPSALRWAVRASAEMSRQSIFDPCSRPLGTGSRATSTWTWDCGMCEIGRRRDGAGCAEGCDARARAIGRDARACAACVETASNGVRSSRWTSNRRLSIELLCWQGVWCTHESRPKRATTLFAEEHRSYTATTVYSDRTHGACRGGHPPGRTRVGTGVEPSI